MSWYRRLPDDIAEVEMNDLTLACFATAWKWIRGLAIGGCAIAFCPVWWGNDWSQASLLLWLGTVVGLVLIALLADVSVRLSREGHEIQSALLVGVIMPLTVHTTSRFGRQGVESFPSSFHGVLDQYFFGYPGLVVAAILLSLAIIGAIGRKSGWKYFPTLGPERSPGDALEATRVDGMTHGAR